jgi:hypothetical protein
VRKGMSGNELGNFFNAEARLSSGQAQRTPSLKKAHTLDAPGSWIDVKGKGLREEEFVSA